MLDRWITAGATDPGRGRMVGLVGLVLRYWRQMVLAYFILLHVVVYFVIFGRHLNNEAMEAAVLAASSTTGGGGA